MFSVFIFAVQLVLAQPTVTEVYSSSSLATVLVTWFIPSVDANLAQYYAFQVQYRLSTAAWTNASDILNFTTSGTITITSLQRIKTYEFRILPLRRKDNLAVIVDPASSSTVYFIRKYCKMFSVIVI